MPADLHPGGGKPIALARTPREGRLLRIVPAAILRIDSHVTEVVRRTAGEDPNGPFVIYHCRSGDQTSELHVTPPAVGGRCALRWIRGERVCELAEDDIEVFQPKSCARDARFD